MASYEVIRKHGKLAVFMEPVKGGELPEEKILLHDGTDATEEVLKAERWLIEHSF